MDERIVIDPEIQHGKPVIRGLVFLLLVLSEGLQVA
jgi:hypothetical protein